MSFGMRARRKFYPDYRKRKKGKNVFPLVQETKGGKILE